MHFINQCSVFRGKTIKGGEAILMAVKYYRAVSLTMPGNSVLYIKPAVSLDYTACYKAAASLRAYFPSSPSCASCSNMVLLPATSVIFKIAE